MNIYKSNGFENREEYLKDLANQYNVSIDVVSSCAEMLGESEDFDGLLCMLEDCESLNIF